MLLEAAAQILSGAGCVAPRAEAAVLTRASAGDPEVLRDLVSRRARGEPIAWLTGTVAFCGLKVVVEPDVYVPRPHTEPLARWAASLLPGGGVAVDLCTGSGAIAAVMAAAVQGSRVLATDVDPIAVRCARRNGVEAYDGYLDDPLPREIERRVDVMIAIAPYVPTDALRLLPRDVQRFEPRLALDGGVDGMDLLFEVVRRSRRWLRPGGWLLMELGGDQGGAVGRVLAEHGYVDVGLIVDGEGDARGIVAHLGEPM